MEKIIVLGPDKYIIKLSKFQTNTFVLQFQNDDIFHQFNFSSSFLSDNQKMLVNEEKFYKLIVETLFGSNPKLSFDVKKKPFVLTVRASSEFFNDVTFTLTFDTTEIDTTKYTKVIKKLRESLQKANKQVKSQNDIIMKQLKMIETMKNKPAEIKTVVVEKIKEVPVVKEIVKTVHIEKKLEAKSVWAFDINQNEKDGEWKNFEETVNLKNGEKRRVVLRTENDFFGCYLGVALSDRKKPKKPVMGYFGSRQMKKTYALSLNEGSIYIGSQKQEYAKIKLKNGDIIDIMLKDNYVSFFVNEVDLGTAFHVNKDVRLCGTLFYKNQRIEIV